MRAVWLQNLFSIWAKIGKYYREKTVSNFVCCIATMFIERDKIKQVSRASSPDVSNDNVEPAVLRSITSWSLCKSQPTAK